MSEKQIEILTAFFTNMMGSQNTVGDLKRIWEDFVVLSKNSEVRTEEFSDTSTSLITEHQSLSWVITTRPFGT
jgi:hypothetical protein